MVIQRNAVDWYLNGTLHERDVRVSVAHGIVVVRRGDEQIASMTISQVVREDGTRLAYHALLNEVAVQVAFLSKKKGCGCGGR